MIFIMGAFLCQNSAITSLRAQRGNPRHAGGELFYRRLLRCARKDVGFVSLNYFYSVFIYIIE
jgi:hypothetical protein